MERARVQESSAGTESEGVADKEKGAESVGGERSARRGEEQEGEGEWVEYVDSLGRSRRCLKEDLAEMERRDKDLAAVSVKRSPR